jgi:hypothetical protein
VGRVVSDRISADRLRTRDEDDARAQALYESVGRVVSDRISAYRLRTQYEDDARAQQIKYMALSTLMTRSMPPDVPMAAYELSVFSQNGEDGVLYEVCRRLDPPRTFVEFGIETGVQGNCVLLADVFGWGGLFIESSTDCYEALAMKYPAGGKVRTLNAPVTPENVEALFAQADVPSEFGILSIDIDGNDYWVWKAVELWHPWVVVIEFNPLLTSGEALVQPYTTERWANSWFFGASITALERLGESKGYRLIYVDLAGVNAFFIRSELDASLAGVERLPLRGVNYQLMGARNQHRSSDRSDWVHV